MNEESPDANEGSELIHQESVESDRKVNKDISACRKEGIGVRVRDSREVQVRTILIGAKFDDCTQLLEKPLTDREEVLQKKNVYRFELRG